MRIQFGTIWLAGDPAESQREFGESSEFSTDGQHVVQIVQRFRADDAEPLARGNALQTVRFSVTRQFATVTAAQEFALDHIGDVLAAGQQTTTFTKADGTTKTMLKCVCTPRVRGLVGLTTIMEYEITGQAAGGGVGGR